jgi:retinol dehydrogenase 12
MFLTSLGIRTKLRNLPGHFYLTKLLLPILISTASQCTEGKTRVVNTSSLAHMDFPKLEFSTFKGDSELRRKLASKMYAQSKFVSVQDELTAEGNIHS